MQTALQVTAVPILYDNYIWVIYDSKTRVALAIDPGESHQLIAFIEAKSLKLEAVLITHHHPDHTAGLPALLQYAAQNEQDLPVYGPSYGQIRTISNPLKDGDQIQFESLGLSFQILYTPGHTTDHICYFSESNQEPWLFCGDTLFSAGCGRLFEGSAAQMYESLQKLARLPESTLIYCAHEYTAANLAFAAQVEPDNLTLKEHQEQVDSWLKQDMISLPSTLVREKAINPFLRADLPVLAQSASNHAGKTITPGQDTFAYLRRWKDNN